MSAAKTTTPPAAPAVAEDYARITPVPGAVLDIGICRFDPDAAPASSHLLMLCGEATGRLSPSGAGGYSERGEPATWPTLAELDASVLEAVVRRTERQYVGWKLDAPIGLGVHDALNVHWGRAQRRWQTAAED